MIQLINTNSLNTFIFNEYITVAQNNSVTLEFEETNTACPLGSITPSTVVLPTSPTNLTAVTVTSTLDCTPDPDIVDTRTFYYEVISPKVIYNRVDKSNTIVFIDISSVSTYDHIHDIPVTNNTWIQNPGFRGRVEIQKYNEDTLSWSTVGYLPLGGALTVTLSEELCDYRAILRIHAVAGCGGHSPVIFEAVGDTFSVKGGYYEVDNPYLKNIIGDELKHYYCERDTTLTVEVEQQLQIEFDSYNIGYTYEYFFSNTSIDLPNFVYNSPSKSLIGEGLSILQCSPETVTFYGCENRFIDGILETQSCSANPSTIEGEYSEEYNPEEYPTDDFLLPSGPGVYTEEFNFTFEVIRPDIVTPVQKDCTYCTTIQDNTLICNPCMIGSVEYEYKTLEGEWCPIKTISRQDLFTHCFCNAQQYVLRNRYTYIEKGCGCNPDRLVFQTEWYEYNLPIEEYKPELDLEDTECCYIEGAEFTIQPTKLLPNNNFCQTSPTLTYHVYEWNKDLKLWEEIGDLQTSYTIDLNDSNWTNLEQYILTLSNLSLQAYKIEAKLTNCCHTTTVERYLNMCPALQITRDCDPEFIKDNREGDTLPCDCQLYHITNHSSEDTYQITVYHTGFKAVTDTITISSLDSIKYTFTDDGIYTLTVKNLSNNNAEDYVLVKYVFCVIDNCFTSILKDILCSYNPDCLCEDEELVKDRARLNKIALLYQTWMRFIEKTYNLSVRYTPIDITYQLKEFEENNSIYEKILKFCEPCAASSNGCCS